MEYTHIIDHIPIPASRPRVSRWSTYYNEPYNSYKKFLEQNILDSIGKKEMPIFSKYEPIIVEVVFEMPIPKSTSKKKTMQMIGEPHTKKSDLDNLVKAVLDSMNGKVFHDDGQICSLVLNKKYSLEPKTIINIREYKW